MRAPTPPNHLDLFVADPAVRAVADAALTERPVAASGASGSSTSLLAGALARITGRLIVLVTAHLDDADEAVDELAAAGVSAVRLPALEVLPGETGVSLDLFAERLAVQRRLAGAAGTLQVVVCPVQALMQGVASPDIIDDLSLTLRAGDTRSHSSIVRWLENAGYSRVDAISEPGDFAVRGGILDIFPPGDGSPPSGGGAGGSDAAEPGVPIRLDFFGDDIESISEIDLGTMGSDRRVRSAELVGASLEHMTKGDAAAVNPVELLPRGSIAIISELLEVTEQARGYYERVIDSRGIWGPPAVFKLLRERCASVLEVGRHSVAAGDAGARPSGRFPLPVSVLRDLSEDAAEAVKELAEMAGGPGGRPGGGPGGGPEGVPGERHRVLVLCSNEAEQHRFGELLAEFAPGAPIESRVAYLHRGFIWGGGDGEPIALVPYHELLHRFQTRRRIRRLRGRSDRAQDAFIDLEVGDYVVHADHGIARFTGMKLMAPRAVKATAEQEAQARLSQVSPLKVGKGKGKSRGTEGHRLDAGATTEEEYLTLEFAASAKLHVPASQIDKVQKYIGGFHGKPPLSTLGGRKWQNQKEQVKESVRDLAKELLRVQAARETQPGTRFPHDTAWQKEFEAEFPFQETEDQLAALGEIKQDMTTARPMDRLLCGDVGYGKTELAIRAAFKAVEFGKQVAVLVPTTILAEQHERTFRGRFADYPFRVESLSRFKTTKEVNDTLAAARKGQVDILIGTHRLLSKDVRFADLGLVIVDEEQRFGVEHKNALLGLRMTADVLTLSATPIPRTLHMAMLGLRDISSLSTAPMDRRAVVTEVCPYNEKRIKQAIERELAREGQVFFVHNRVHNIKSVADDIQKLAPDARIVIGHGQMPDDELEKVMRTFITRQADILVSTTIIESGIDIPTANTMIINMADRFGLAELHQLRGRVGRYKHRAYCYLLLPPDRPLTDIAARRLRAIEEFSMLGAGFKIAMRDLEIRGAGNLLGAEQSGHIAAVGYDMYCRLLESATHELKSERVVEQSLTTIEIGLTGVIPKLYIPSDSRRLEAYRRIATARSLEELLSCVKAMQEAYGKPPKPVDRLTDLAALRIGAQTLGVRAMSLHEQDVIIRCEDPAPVLKALEGVKGSVRPIALRPGEKLHEVYFRPPPSFLEPESLLLVLRRRFAPEWGAEPKR